MTKQRYLITLNDNGCLTSVIANYIRHAIHNWSGQFCSDDERWGLGNDVTVVKYKLEWKPIEDCEKIPYQSYIVYCKADHCVYVAYWDGKVWKHFAHVESPLQQAPTKFKYLDLPKE